MNRVLNGSYRHHCECTFALRHLDLPPVCYLAHVPLALLLSLLHVVHVLSLVGWHHPLLLHAHVAPVGQSHARHHGPSTHHGGGRHASNHCWGESLLGELHLRLAHVHTC